jgi:hypothetical protein
MLTKRQIKAKVYWLFRPGRRVVVSKPWTEQEKSDLFTGLMLAGFMGLWLLATK